MRVLQFAFKPHFRCFVAEYYDEYGCCRCGEEVFAAEISGSKPSKFNYQNRHGKNGVKQVSWNQEAADFYKILQQNFVNHVAAFFSFQKPCMLQLIEVILCHAGAAKV